MAGLAVLQARADAPVITAAGGNGQVVAAGSAAVVDAALTVTGTSSVSGALVLITNFQTGDVLGYSAGALPGGVTGSWSSSTGVLTFAGTATTAQWQTLLRTVTITATAVTPAVRTVTFSMGGSLPYSSTGHFYEFVTDAQIPWDDAQHDAEARDLFGLQGYLVTVTSAGENSFVVSKLEGQGWMGASDAAAEGVWRWVSGPEGLEAGGGRHFFTQTSACNVSPNKIGVYGGSTPGGGVAVGSYFEWWANAEPNDCEGTVGEDYAHFLSNGEWNDYPITLNSILGYVVEYGGMPGDPTLQITANRGMQIAHLLTYSAAAHGSITGTTPQTVNRSGNGTSVLAEPAFGYHFTQWSDSSTANPRTDTNITANLTVTASFAINTYEVQYEAGAHGSIAGSALQLIQHGQNAASVTAVPAAGYRFAQWSDGLTATTRTDTNVTSDLTVSAYFVLNTFTLTYSAGAGGTITGTAVQSVASGADGSPVTAVPDAGYIFLHWSDGSTANPRTDLGVSASVTVSARFATTATIQTAAISNITETTATCGGSVTAEGGADVTVRGVCWSTNAAPTTADASTANGAGSGTFVSTITGLNVGTTYRVRAYAVNAAGTSYGAEQSFTTPAPPDDGADGEEPPTAPDLRVDIVNSTEQTGVGGNVEFQVNVQNLGTGVASATVLRIPLPDNAEFISASLGTGVLNAYVEGGYIVIELGDVSASETFAISLVLRARTAGDINLSAEATSDESTTPSTAESGTTVEVANEYWEVINTIAPLHACGVLGFAPACCMLAFAGMKRRSHSRRP